MAATVVEEALCVLELEKTNSITLVQRHFRRRYGKRLPTRQSIYDWSKKSVICIVVKSLIISFQYNIESVYFFYSNSVLYKKEANLIKQNYMAQETAAQNMKNQLKSSTENEKTEELNRKPMHGQFYRGLPKDHQ